MKAEGKPVVYGDGNVHICQNCEGRFPSQDALDPIHDLFERVAAGEPMPSGQCPKCGALCHRFLEEVGSAKALCRKAGRDPDEEITRFVLEDYAAALLDDGERDEEEVVGLVREADIRRLADALLEGSGWSDIFDAYAMVA
jgi:hypothetical protein